MALKLKRRHGRAGSWRMVFARLSHTLTSCEAVASNFTESLDAFPATRCSRDGLRKMFSPKLFNLP